VWRLLHERQEVGSFGRAGREAAAGQQGIVVASGTHPMLASKQCQLPRIHATSWLLLLWRECLGPS
jgi:hypothetical protein